MEKCTQGKFYFHICECAVCPSLKIYKNLHETSMFIFLPSFHIVLSLDGVKEKSKSKEMFFRPQKLLEWDQMWNVLSMENVELRNSWNRSEHNFF